MQAMSEIILFQQRMHFSALRHYSESQGMGGVAAVFFAPAAADITHWSEPPTNEAVALRVVAGHEAPTSYQP